MSSTSKLTPSYYGYVGSTKDALLIIQAIVNKQLDLISRRPHEKERPLLIKSGNVFVFIEEHSGIKRWTDGIAWSPSRILGRFLVYRELDKHSLSEKDDKKKKKRKVSHNPDPLDTSSNKVSIPSAHQLLPDLTTDNRHAYDDHSHLDNNHNDKGNSYVFKDQGLIKKTLSLTTVTKDVHIDHKVESQTIHLISYYNADDVLNGKLQRPSETDLKNLSISATLWDALKESSLGGKIPIEDEAYYFLDTNYQLQNMSLLQQPPINPPRIPSTTMSSAPPPPNQLPPPINHNQYISSQPQPTSQPKFNQGLPMLPLPLQTAPPPPHAHGHTNPPTAPPIGQSYHPYKYEEYGQPQYANKGAPQQPQQQQQQPAYGMPPTYVKREEDLSLNSINPITNGSAAANPPTNNSGELTFINPFGAQPPIPNAPTGSMSAPVTNYNSNSGSTPSGSGSLSGSNSVLPFFNNTYMLPQQYSTNFTTHQVPDSNGNSFSHTSNESPAQQLQQHASTSSVSGPPLPPSGPSGTPQQQQPPPPPQQQQQQQGYYPPFPPQQHFQQMFPQQSNHLGSISGSSDQFSLSGQSNGSISSIGSNMIHGGSSQNSLSGPAGQKKHFRSGSGNGNGSWFTTTTNSTTGGAGIGGGGYITGAPTSILSQEPLGASQISASHENSNLGFHHPSSTTLTNEDSAGQPYMTSGANYTSTN